METTRGLSPTLPDTHPFILPFPLASFQPRTVRLHQGISVGLIWRDRTAMSGHRVWAVTTRAHRMHRGQRCSDAQPPPQRLVQPQTPVKPGPRGPDHTYPETGLGHPTPGQGDPPVSAYGVCHSVTLPEHPLCARPSSSPGPHRLTTQAKPQHSEAAAILPGGRHSSVQDPERPPSFQQLQHMLGRDS